MDWFLSSAEELAMLPSESKFSWDSDSSRVEEVTHG